MYNRTGSITEIFSSVISKCNINYIILCSACAFNSKYHVCSTPITTQVRVMFSSIIIVTLEAQHVVTSLDRSLYWSTVNPLNLVLFLPVLWVVAMSKAECVVLAGLCVASILQTSSLFTCVIQVVLESANNVLFYPPPQFSGWASSVLFCCFNYNYFYIVVKFQFQFG